MTLTPEDLTRLAEAVLARLHEEKLQARRGEFEKLKAKYGSSVGSTGPITEDEHRRKRDAYIQH